jgi:DNA-binding LytR/AlgR family response regulator
MSETKATCIIVDDEPLAIRLLTAHVSQVPQLTLLGSFENPVKALAFLRENKVDLLLLDIQMPTLTGLEFVRTLPNESRVIFTTAYREFAVESYELDVVDYLVKPITFSRFYQAVDKFLLLNPSIAPASAPEEKPAPLSPAFRFVNVNKKHVKVYYEQITYIESMKDYIRICTIDGEVVTREGITDFAGQLPDYFLRIHRSFIVNIRKITAFTAHDVEVGEYGVPIGVSYKSAVMERLNAGR